MDDDGIGSLAPASSPLRDARQDFVQRTALWLLVFSSVAAAIAALLHWQDPQSRATDRIAPC